MQPGQKIEFVKLSDDSLMRLVVLRRSEALSVLYDRYSRLVFSLALNVVGDRETAEEVAQDVFYQVWENAATYRPDQAKLTTWMTSITRYRAIDVLRKRRSRPEKDSVEWAETALHTTPRPEEGPEELADLLLQQERVRLAVNSLSSDQQAVLALAYFQGLSHSQIAGQLNQPLGTVKTRIRLAMQRLRELLIEEP